MDLSKIIIKSVRANNTKNFVKSLEELPQGVVRGKNSGIIKAYNSPIGSTVLDVIVDSIGQAKKITFHVPKGASNIKKGEYCIEFDYKAQHYKLGLEREWGP